MSLLNTSMCARHSLLQFKFEHRAHIPQKIMLSKMYPELSPKKRPQCLIDKKCWLCPSLEDILSVSFPDSKL